MDSLRQAGTVDPFLQADEIMYSCKREILSWCSRRKTRSAKMLILYCSRGMFEIKG